MEIQNREKKEEMIRTAIKILNVLNDDNLSFAEDVALLSWIVKAMLDRAQYESENEQEQEQVENSRQLIAEIILGTHRI
jgi:UDP-N-acetylglucosamine pyrophosphorylase